jgi:hypothetical protein
MPDFNMWNWDWLLIPALAILTGIMGMGYEWLRRKISGDKEE